MYKEIAKLIMYGNMKEDTILVKLGEIFRAFDEKTEDNAQLIRDIYTQLKRLLEVATDYGFDHNLWHNYLTYLLITNENPFSVKRSVQMMAASIFSQKMISECSATCFSLILNRSRKHSVFSASVFCPITRQSAKKS